MIVKIKELTKKAIDDLKTGSTSPFKTKQTVICENIQDQKKTHEVGLQFDTVHINVTFPGNMGVQLARPGWLNNNQVADLANQVVKGVLSESPYRPESGYVDYTTKVLDLALEDFRVYSKQELEIITKRLTEQVTKGLNETDKNTILRKINPQGKTNTVLAVFGNGGQIITITFPGGVEKTINRPEGLSDQQFLDLAQGVVEGVLSKEPYREKFGYRHLTLELRTDIYEPGRRTYTFTAYFTPKS